MTKIVNPKIFNSLKHGVTSKHGKLPWEKVDAYASLEAKWRRVLRQHGTILEGLVTGIVRNRLASQRNSQTMAIFVACHPFGRAVTEAAGEGDWFEAARKYLNEVNAMLITLVQTAELLRKQAVTTENTANGKRRSKAADKLADAAQRIAAQHEQAMSFILGVGDENRKQADRDTEFDGRLNKLLTNYFQFEQMLATRAKLVLHVSHQSSADAHDEFIDDLPEKSEPKAACSASEKKALPDPKKDSFDDADDWDAPQKQ